MKKLNSKNIVSVIKTGVMVGLGVVAANQLAGKLLPNNTLAQVGGKTAAGVATSLLLGQPLLAAGMIGDALLTAARSTGVISGTPRRRRSQRSVGGGSGSASGRGSTAGGQMAGTPARTRTTGFEGLTYRA